MAVRWAPEHPGPQWPGAWRHRTALSDGIAVAAGAGASGTAVAWGVAPPGAALSDGIAVAAGAGVSCTAVAWGVAPPGAALSDGIAVAAGAGVSCIAVAWGVAPSGAALSDGIAVAAGAGASGVSSEPLHAAANAPMRNRAPNRTIRGFRIVS